MTADTLPLVYPEHGEWFDRAFAWNGWMVSTSVRGRKRRIEGLKEFGGDLYTIKLSMNRSDPPVIGLVNAAAMTGQHVTGTATAAGGDHDGDDAVQIGDLRFRMLATTLIDFTPTATVTVTYRTQATPVLDYDTNAEIVLESRNLDARVLEYELIGDY